MPLFRTASTLSVHEWRLFFVSLVALPAVDICLRLRGLKRTQATLARLLRPKPAPVTDGDADYARSAARAVSIAARRAPWPTSCLRQALWLESLLRHRGISCETRFGVERPSAGGALRAHAWVVRGGEILIGGAESDKHYHVLER